MPGPWDDLDECTQIRARAACSVERILLAESDPATRRWVRVVVAGSFGLEEVDSGRAALDRIANTAPRIVIVGRQLTDMSGEELLAHAAPHLGNRAAPISVFLLGTRTGTSADVDESEINVFYRLNPTMEAARVTELLSQAAAQFPKQPESDVELPPRVVELAKLLGEAPDLAAAAHICKATLHEVVGVDRARCLFCDEDSGALWAEGTDEEAQASTGLAGFAVRTTSTILVPRAAEDSMYRREADDPQGTGRERIAFQPIAGVDGHVHAVLVAIREEHRPPFKKPEIAMLEAISAAFAPYLQQLAMRVEADSIIGERLEQGPSDLFRQEAIASFMRRGARGDVVRVHPGWVHAAYWLVLASLGAVFAFAALAHVHQYAEGAAVVRFSGRDDIVAYDTGTIGSLEVARGQQVKAGQVLARLHDAEEVGRLRAQETEFERKLVAYLQTPADPNVRQSLSQAVSQRDSARASVESRVIRAPHAGTVRDVLVRNNQHVDAGTVVLSISESDVPEGVVVLAFLPGGDRPRLHAHQALSIRLPGYRGSRITSEVHAVSSEVLGATEARKRYLGERFGDSLPLTGSVVVVEARLASAEFEADGNRYQLHDGMIGLAEVQLESKSVLRTLLPEWR